METRMNPGRRNDRVTGKNKDRISNLPESIRSYILSFLPTVDAVAASVLSSKWKNLWATISSIRLDDSQPPFKCMRVEQDGRFNLKFARFANRVLLLHNLQSLNKFSLHCSLDSSLYDIQAWISTALLKNVRDLDLSIGSGFPIRLPNSLFTCKTLETLRLHGSILIIMPANPCLQKLRSLKLEAVEYENDECPKKLISSCPSLKSLVIRRVRNDNVNTFTISSTALRVLEINKGQADESTIIKFEINAPYVPSIRLLGTSLSKLKIEY